MKLLKEIGGGILLLQMPVFLDERGSFIKLWDKRLLEIRSYEQKQLNYVVNKQRYTCRGLHFQKGNLAESKIFRVLSGSIQLIAFGVQKGSPFYRQTFTERLSKPDLALWVPREFATGYCTLEDHTTVLYSSDNDYHPEAEAGLRWNDPAIGYTGLPFGSLMISEKDGNWPDF